MVALTVRESYATVLEADQYLENNALWQVASEEVKYEALLEARYYIDTNFSCADISAETVVPDKLIYATAVLAADLLANPDIFSTGANIKREYVKAEVVSETEYFGGNTPKPTKLSQIKGILKGQCTYNASTVFLQRG